FSLQPDPEYPADFTVDYPEQLSRVLVLVKWWLLAVPHYLIVAAFIGAVGVDGLGLIGLLAVIAMVINAFRHRYPESIFDFVRGLTRGCYGALAYAALMRDESPPFRVDYGGTDERGAL